MQYARHLEALAERLIGSSPIPGTNYAGKSLPRNSPMVDDIVMAFRQ
jgi:hypothetical protein